VNNMAEKKLLISGRDGYAMTDADNYREHFPNIEFMEKARAVPTYSARTKDGTLSSGT
tara:strand:+ start:342 stop:515 length:174 start_codon:yes stop_codon:yes gene_type:complete